ncbi:peptidase G2 autoproteolytic cleavage domain-containing protein [Epibacterium ulvae]|uniref:peptidase G2 autoproteolytic cleavage domain-containing protein n=1 Tax=Epibacterium ulvae TaxID=1156985 RepID=UPI002492E1EB|nr:peptidase G2 autoproteolytic cleavage domain-containing protein [Epibacterium ulvae]
MSDHSSRLDLPLLLPAQAQKHVTHNEALRLLDGLVQLVVQNIHAETPPSGPTVGLAYAIGSSPNGIWAGHALQLAIWQGEGWLYLTPDPGWRLWDLNSAQMWVWSGTNWQSLPCYRTPQIGINSSADSDNRLTVAAQASLFNHEGQGHQLKVNKARSSDTASFVLQNAFSGRAEIGLAGSDDLSVKLSANGSQWDEALVLSAANGPRLRLRQSASTGDLLQGEAGGAVQFRLSANGNGHCTGSWQAGGADYAEFFEWADGNPDDEDRRGLSVVLDGDKIRPARDQEIPIGVISATPALLGDADLAEWPGKYQRDAFGARLYHSTPSGEKEPRLSAVFDPTQTYIPRSARSEWAIVGLLGKLVLRAGQPTDPRWRYLSPHGDGLERWLVR